MRFIRLLFVLALIAAAAAAAGFWWEERYFTTLGPAASETVVVIQPGSSLGTIAEDLEKAGAVKNALLFRLGVMRRGKASALKAGEYGFPAHSSESDVLDMLVEHKSIQHKVTIAEGLTSEMAAAVLKADAILTGEPPAVPEGSLLPETYLFERGTTRADILARMHKAQEALLVELWPKRKAGLPFTTPEDALKLASIVEKETSVPSERARVAAVFVNRLMKGMKLESDPTIIYGLTKGAPLGHALRQSELATPNPYSTYQILGLPPTPICNPGRGAVAAVLNPVASEELFFVADGSGGHVFAKTIAEHQRNVAAWRRKEQGVAR